MIPGSKITDQHLERIAYVYVRQSTMHQVREHRESKRRQYALRDKATDLGFKQVVVLDQDMGVSGSGTQERPGFGKLLAAVCEGTVGAVFALEASRLARNNRDWHHLVDLCALTDTVLVDSDGVYDPRLLNDRLLLGLKGTMSEFELGLLRQRAQAAFMDKVRRGAVLWDVPVGYLRTDDDGLEKTPDLQIQRAIEGVFTKFRELGTARQVTLWYREEKVPLPRVVRATRGREVTWQLPSGHYVRKLLKNPCYAGAHAYGCTEARSVFKDGRARRTTRRRKPIEEWSVLIKDHHESYLKWEEFLRNQELLEANVAKWSKGTGAAKEGSALLSGLLRCGRCGRKLAVNYSGKNGLSGRYCCKGRSPARGSSPCLGVGSAHLDDAVAGVLLDAVQPAGVQAALQAIEQETSGRDEKRQALELALQKARYEATRAQRQYDACDPDNRLVANQLEARWNAALKQVTDLEARLQEFAAATPPLATAERARLLDLGSDLFQLWNHPQASNKLRKRIARTLLEEILVDLTVDPPEVVLKLHWQGGIHTELRLPRPRTGQHRRAVGRDVLELVRELAKVCQDKDTARILNRLGFRTGQGNTWRASRVQSLRHYHDLPPASPDKNALTLEQAAAALQVSNTVVQRLIKEGVLPAEQVVTYAPWIIKREDLDLPEVQDAVEAVHSGRRRRRPRTSPGQTQLPFSQGQGKV